MSSVITENEIWFFSKEVFVKKTRTLTVQSVGEFVNRNRSALLFLMVLAVAASPGFSTTLPSDSFGWLNTVKGWVLGPLGVTLGTIGAIGACALVAITQGRGIGVLFWVFVGMGLGFGMPNIISLFFPNAGSSGFLLP